MLSLLRGSCLQLQRNPGRFKIACVASAFLWFRSKEHEERRDFRFWPRKEWNEYQKMKEEGGGGEGGNANRRLAWPILGTGSRVQSFPRALPLPNDVPVLLLNQPIVYSGRQDLPFLALVPFPARPNRKSRSSICLPSETKRKRLLRALPKFMFLTLESDVLESAHRLSLGCLCFKRKLPEVLTFAEWKAPPGALPFIWK